MPKTVTNKFHITQCVRGEVGLSREVYTGSPRPYSEIPACKDWSRNDSLQQQIGAGLRRGRTVLEALRYGRAYWQRDFCFIIVADPLIFGHRSLMNRMDAERLLELIALSRVDTEPVDNTWSLPRPNSLPTVMNEMRQELGVAEAYERQLHDPTEIASSTPSFPGVSERVIVSKLLSGALAVNNIADPEPVLYHNS